MIPSKNALLAPDRQVTVLAPPIASLPASALSDSGTVESAVPLSHYFWILKRNCWKIIGFIVFCVLATFLVSSRLTRIYEATATIDIDRQSPTSIIGQEATRSMLNDSEQFLATQ